MNGDETETASADPGPDDDTDTDGTRTPERTVGGGGRLARLRALAPGALTALAAGGAGVAGSFAVAGATPGFVGAPIAGLLARSMPGIVVTLAITLLGDLGQALNLATAVGLAAVGLALPVAGARTLAARTGLPGVLEAALGGVGVAALAALVAGPTAAAAGAGLAAAAVAALPHAPGVRRPGRAADGRRRALTGLAGLLGVGVIGYATGAGRTGGERGTDEEAALDPAVTEKLELASERSLGIEGIEPLVSREFYNVDINSVDPTLETDGWSLSVTGAVEEPYSIDYETLTSRESREEFVSLRCVGEGINGKKLDNALWTVVDAMPILEAAGLPDECCVMARAADDFYEEFPLAAMEDAMLAYRMNGRPLPRAHGRPVRLLVPGHWGEINVKWIDEIEILNEPAEGYWEERGWHGTGPVNTVAKLHATNVRDDGTIEVGGHAYAGVRGIERVEVSTDGGESWTDAALSERLPGIDVWRQWRHVYEADGEHEVVVRATDGEGTLQPEKRQQAYPSGATGWVSETVGP